MASKIIQCMLGFFLTVLLFSYATWGNFSWVTLTGPLALEPDLNTLEGPGYIASPALQAVIIRLFFLLACFFFCMIPNLARGLRQHARYLLGHAAAVYFFFSYLLGSFTFFASNAPGASTLRITTIIFFFILLVIGYDASRGKFRPPGLLLEPNFIIPLASLAITVCLAVSLIFDGPLWLLKNHMHFVLLRMGVILTVLTGALAFHLWRRGS